MLFQAMFGAFYAALAHQELPGTPTINSVNDIKALYLCYGSAYACMAGCLAGLYRHTLSKLHLQHAERVEARKALFTQSGSVCVALLSLVAALLIPPTSAWTALPGCIYILLSPMYWLAGRWARRAIAGAT
jgi:hypothetical protein